MLNLELSNAPVNVYHHAPPPTGRPNGILTVENFFCPRHHPHFHFLCLTESPLFPTPGGGNLFIFNVRTAPVSEHHCHKPMRGRSENYQNPLGCLMPPWGFTLTGA